MALRDYAFGRIQRGKERIALALAADQHFVKHGEHFAAAVYESARHYWLEQEGYLDLVLADLPAALQGLASRRSVFLGWMLWWSAAEHHARGRWSSAGRDLAAALRHRPSFAPRLLR